MSRVADQASPDVIITVMGASGAGKSSFIHLLTGDDNIKIGHKPESQTSDIQTAFYVDQMTGRRVMLVDTPGFDDSRDEVTDTYILEKITGFLQPGQNEARTLNGIIYMHRISDPKVGGVARKNLKMLHSLCGDANLKHIRIVTTGWEYVSEQTGSTREADLKANAFKALMDGGADLRRHADTVESAQRILSELICLTPVTMQIQDELRTGMKLGDTSAGSILITDMQGIQKKHEKELASLQRELEEAATAHDLVLRAELAQERGALELKMTRADGDRKRLERAMHVNQAEEPCEPNTTKVAETLNIFQNTVETRQLPGMESEVTTDLRRVCPRCGRRLAGRSPVGRFFGEMGDVTDNFMKAGKGHLGSVGELAGFVIGILAAPFVVAGRGLCSEEHRFTY